MVPGAWFPGSGDESGVAEGPSGLGPDAKVIGAIDAGAGQGASEHGLPGIVDEGGVEVTEVEAGTRGLVTFSGDKSRVTKGPCGLGPDAEEVGIVDAGPGENPFERGLSGIVDQGGIQDAEIDAAVCAGGLTAFSSDESGVTE